MFFESHFKLEGQYGKPFAAFPKPGGDSFLVWYADDRGNVVVVEAWLMGKDELSKKGIQIPKPVLAIEQPRDTSRRLAP
jgi:hypothetical protein